MLPTLKLASTLAGTDSLAIIIKDARDIPANILSAQEKKFVENEFKEKRNTVVVNQYHRLVIIHRLKLKDEDEDKKNNGSDAMHRVSAILESCRKAGDTISSAVNKQKKRTVTVM